MPPAAQNDFSITGARKTPENNGKGLEVSSPFALILAEILAELVANARHFASDIINVKYHLHHADLIVINGFVKLCLDGFFANMINRESQRDSCQRTCESGVTSCDCLSGQTRGFTLCCAEENDNVLSAILIREIKNSLLIFQIHCTCGCSDEALRRREDDLCASSLCTFFDGRAGNAVSVADDDNFLTIKNAHGSISSSFYL